jgi:BirA family biotin operon repressor/biotin-[acetyl-CoA-carboxylase] ligase
VKLQELYPLLGHLAEAGFHSGEALAEMFGITRAAVWKQIQALNQIPGIDIQSVRGKGYRLDSPLQLLDRKSIESRLPRHAGKHLQRLTILAETASTNDWLRDHLPSRLNTGHACLAEFQNAARGRRGRQWICTFGSNIYLSLAWRFDLAMADLAGLSLAVGVSVAETLKEHGLETHGLKWPNDIYLDGRKLGGILVEASGEMAGPAVAVIGIGINLKMTDQNARDIDQPWTDMASSLDTLPRRNHLCGDLLAGLLDTCLVYQKQGLSPFLEAWKRYDIYLGKAVELHMGGRVISGIYCGLDERGGLVLDDSGDRRAWYAGEVSLRSAKN